MMTDCCHVDKRVRFEGGGNRSILAFADAISLMGSMGLLPAALSQGMGSEIQKPIAIMIVGYLLNNRLIELLNNIIK